MSVGTNNKRKLRNVASFAVRNGWEVVLLTEVRADNNGIVWLGENNDLMAVIHSERAAVMIRGEVLKEWCDSGQIVEYKERCVVIRMKRMVFVSVYMPVWNGNNDVEREACKEDLKRQVETAKRDQILVVGGDFNSHIGGGEERPGVCGIFGLRESNPQGVGLLEWCEDNQLVHVNSFYNHRRRGTWFSGVLGRWYEIDGFLMRNNQRHKFVKKVCSIGEITLSDHRPKMMVIELESNLPKKETVKRVPRIRYEKLRLENVAVQFRQRIDEIIDEDEGEADMNIDKTKWDELTNIVTRAAKDVCGTEEKKVDNPWLIGKEDEIQRMRSRVTTAINSKNELIVRNRELDGLEQELEVAKTELKDARRELNKKTKDWEKEWWQEIINECQEAGERGETGAVYKILKKLGQRGERKAPESTTLTKEDFQQHFKRVSEERFENTPEDIDNLLDELIIEETDKTREWRERLEEVPSSEEIIEQMKKMKDSAPGKDGVRLSYLLKGGSDILDRVVNMVQFMFLNDAEKWEESLKIGLVIPLHKKGDRNDCNKYRGVVLLAMGSRILARVLADRIRIWAEAMELLDEEQAGFRKGRNTADVTQIMYRIQEDATDLKRRVEKNGGTIPDEEKPSARLLDLKKAYPRVNKYAMWKILRKYGMGERSLRAIMNLHETTEYRVKSREGESDPWIPQRGLREGCPSSPPLFNIFHQVSMRLATRARKRRADEMGLEMGLTYKWVPGSCFPSDSRWEKPNSDAKKIKIDKALFADDTTKCGKKKELDEGVRVTKAIMLRLEEKNNDDKEEVLEFGEDSSDKIRMLGCYMGWKEDIKQRSKRAGMAWSKVRRRLKGSRMSKRMQARIVEACVESTILFDCQARTWQAQEVKKLQSIMDRIYRNIWSKHTKPPLIQMQEEHKNMQDVRNELKIKSLRLKVEKRVLERVGHIMRMEDTRHVKAVTLGWLEELESHEKMPGKKRKTVLYWKKLLKEGGIDWTQIDTLTKDRAQWKQIVRERSAYLEEWERRGGHRVAEERGPRNITETNDDLMCEEEGCGKICKNKAGLSIHRKRMHNISSQKVYFKCDKCGESFTQQGNLNNHKKICTGLRSENPTNRKCNLCQKEILKTNFKRHYTSCQRKHANQDGTVIPDPEPDLVRRAYTGKRGNCPVCGVEMSVANISRHQDSNRCPGGAALV
jgi:hypothetical protein